MNVMGSRTRQVSPGKPRRGQAIREDEPLFRRVRCTFIAEAHGERPDNIDVTTFNVCP